MSLKEYGPVPIEDERDDESEGLPDPRYSSMIMRPRNSTFLRRSIYFLLAQLLIVVVTAFVSVSLFQRYWRASCAGDGLESHIAVELRTINRYPREQEEAIWANLTSGDEGYILIDNPDRYGLPPGVPNGIDGYRNVYGVSWTHQLHCLMMIRDQYHSMQGMLKHDRRDDHGDLHHIEHCFDYLRQNIECVSDMTIEWADKERTNKEDLQINGYGISHQCRKRESVLAYMAARVPPAAEKDMISGAHVGHHHGAK